MLKHAICFDLTVLKRFLEQTSRLCGMDVYMAPAWDEGSYVDSIESCRGRRRAWLLNWRGSVIRCWRRC